MPELSEFVDAFDTMSIFEILMLVCFGVSWPASIVKLLKTKTSAGKSFRFLWLIFAGYVFGTVHKLVHSRDPVIVVYLFNLTCVGVDILLSYRYRPADKEGR